LYKGAFVIKSLIDILITDGMGYWLGTDLAQKVLTRLIDRRQWALKIVIQTAMNAVLFEQLRGLKHIQRRTALDLVLMGMNFCINTNTPINSLYFLKDEAIYS
jgi:hypothetical protein